ncbi:sodium/calcium exchanger 2-like isoform X2 [Anneissia japonica]|uniref:sodium/calcium exchanger 2-like isoform X2 n=1 Tax=Anneissia japonica TaxID=1529436 RepID=UPI00142593E9|nr:sodium/calcium exchanger 2-like isoform X2 [Anneissia japonica]
MVMQHYSNYSRGYVVEVYGKGDKVCSSWLLLPAENLWSEGVRGFLYILAMVYIFIGIAIISDVFMCSIEVITSKKKTVVRWDAEKNTRTEREVLVWNETVANLTLMALGSSAPEILLAVVETISTISDIGNKDSLGTFTIIGSAAFNLLMITAVCIASVPSPETKKVKDFGVFMLTAVWSIFAYIWLLIVLLWITPQQIDMWEAWVTLGFFPVLVLSAYAQDNGWWCSKRGAVGVEGGNISQHNVRVINGGPKKSLIHGISPSLAHLEAEKTQRMTRDAEIGDEDSRLLRTDSARTTFARAKFRHAAVRSLLGGKRAHVRSPGPPRMLALVEKVQNIQSHRQTDVPPAASLVGTFTFASQSYSVLESAGKLDIDVLFHRKPPIKSPLNSPQIHMNGSAVTYQAAEDTCTSNDDDSTNKDYLKGPVSVLYETRDGSAKNGTEYEYTKGKLDFGENESQKSVSIPIINDNQYENDMEFYVILKSPEGVHAKGLGDPSIARVTIIDDDEPGEFSFDKAAYSADANGVIRATVVRSKGSDGDVTLQYYTLDGSALGGDSVRTADFKKVSATLSFKHGETSKQIVVHVNKDITTYKNFVINMKNLSLGAKLGEHPAAVANINGDEIADRVANLMTDSEDETWKGQIRSAMTVGGDEDEKGNVIPPSMIDYLLHFISFFWKVLFAFVPPRSMLGGWPAFGTSLVLIGVLTALVEQLGTLIGCVLNIKASVAGITIIALGTSVPDTFASRTAALQDKHADAAIGNITGSNSVNVFLGLGLPWVIKTIYCQVKNQDFVVSTTGLDLAVILFTSVGIVCLILLAIRRKFIGGELGGKSFTKYLSSSFLTLLWFIYVLVASLRAYEIIG